MIRKECTRIQVLDQVLFGRMVADAFSDHPATQRADRVTALFQEHPRIFRAIAKGDGAAARQAMEEHRSPLVEKCVAAVRREGRQRQVIADHLKLIEI